MISDDSLLQISFGLTEIIKRIRETIDLECIYLLGQQFTHAKLVSIYSDHQKEQETLRMVHLLIVKKMNETRNEESIQAKVDCLAKSFASVIVWSISSESFKEKIKSNDRFASWIFQRGKLCLGECKFDTENFQTTAQYCESMNSSKWFNSAKEFLVGAELFFVRKEFRLAAFMLHQAAEQSYIGHIYVLTGYKATIHNLHRLHQYSLQLSFEVSGIFPRNNENEERLFQILKKAYVNSRYAQDFYVAQSDLKILFERIKKLSGIDGTISCSELK